MKQQKLKSKTYRSESLYAVAIVTAILIDAVTEDYEPDSVNPGWVMRCATWREWSIG